MNSTLTQRQQDIINYHISVGINTEYKNNNIKKYLELSQTELSKLSLEELIEAGVLLSQESFFLQKEIAKFTAIINWANKSIDYLISDHLKDVQGYMTADQKRVLSIRYTPAAKELEEFIVQTKLKLDSISYLPAQLHNLSYALLEMSKSKRNIK